MTLFNVYNLYDATAESYIAQFLNTHDKLMKREAENIYNNAKKMHEQNAVSPQGSIYRYADEYYIYKTATFDDKTGVYTPLEIKQQICNFGDFRIAEKSDLETYSDLCTNKQ